MSVIGTGIAAGVANTTQQAKQSVQQRAGEQAQRASSENQTDKVKISQLQGAAATRDSDEDMPDQAPPGYEDLYGKGDGETPPETDDAESPQTDGDIVDLIHRADAPACSPTGLPLSGTYGPRSDTSTRAPLYQQIDVKA